MRNLRANFIILTISCCVNFMHSLALGNETLSDKSILKKVENAIIAKKAITSIKQNQSVVSYIVNIEQAGQYYLSCWMLGGQYLDGSYSSYSVSVNGIDVGRMNATKANWQSVQLSTGGTIVLQKGENTISFSTQIPEIPNIEFIKLATIQEFATISSENYDSNLNKIIEHCAANQDNKEICLSTIQTDTIPHVNQVRMAIDGEAHYQYVPNLPLKYTFHLTAYYTQGQNIILSVTNVSGSSTMLEIFHETQPEIYSWSWLIAFGATSSNTITCPATGNYKIRLRSYQKARDGIVNVTINGITYTNLPTYSYGIVYTHQAGIEYNTFTTNLRLNHDGDGDPVLSISKGSPDKIVAYNDDYTEAEDWGWEFNSRIVKQFMENTKSVFVYDYTSYGSNSSPSCDLYIGCRTCRIDTLFENLYQNDVIESAPYNEIYNCFSWSGGSNSYWEDPTFYTSDYYIDPYRDLEAFDLFYSSERYLGCGIYSRNGATELNSVVDLWGYTQPGRVIYSHASIKHGADDHPHGYDWESKAGEMSRIFHPRYALEGDPYEEPGGYGEIMEHYRLVGIGNPFSSDLPILHEENRIFTLEESIAEGFSVLEHIQFTDAEDSLINTKIRDIDEIDVMKFNAKYQIWKNTCNKFHSMFRFYRTTEYKELLAFCKSLKKSEFLIYKKLGEGDIFSMLLICDIFLSDIPKNECLLNDIKTENKKNKMIENNRIIVRSPYSNTMKFVKRLINNTYMIQTRGTNSSDEGFKYSNSDKFVTSSTNEGLNVSFEIIEDSKISLSILDLQGLPLVNILQNDLLKKGSYSYLIKELSTNICLVCYSVNGNLNVKKIYIR